MKPGNKSSEFWLSLAAVIGMVLVALALIVTNQTGEIGGVLTALGIGLGATSGSYSLGRSYVKGQHAQEPA